MKRKALTKQEMISDIDHEIMTSKDKVFLPIEYKRRLEIIESVMKGYSALVSIARDPHCEYSNDAVDVLDSLYEERLDFLQ